MSDQKVSSATQAADLVRESIATEPDRWKGRALGRSVPVEERIRERKAAWWVPLGKRTQPWWGSAWGDEAYAVVNKNTGKLTVEAEPLSWPEGEERPPRILRGIVRCSVPVLLLVLVDLALYLGAENAREDRIFWQFAISAVAFLAGVFFTMRVVDMFVTHLYRSFRVAKRHPILEEAL